MHGVFLLFDCLISMHIREHRHRYQLLFMRLWHEFTSWNVHGTVNDWVGFPCIWIKTRPNSKLLSYKSITCLYFYFSFLMLVLCLCSGYIGLVAYAKVCIFSPANLCVVCVNLEDVYGYLCSNVVSFSCFQRCCRCRCHCHRRFRCHM